MKPLIDVFVETVNKGQREPLMPDCGVVPENIRVGVPDDFGWWDWRITPCVDVPWFDRLQSKLPKLFPALYRQLCTSYVFPAFCSGEIFFFGNTGDLTYEDELSVRIFSDPVMGPFLLKNAMLQFGRPANGDYDPVCFDTRRNRGKALDCPVVRIDHEAILCDERLVIVREIAPSFEGYLVSSVEDELHGAHPPNL